MRAIVRAFFVLLALAAIAATPVRAQFAAQQAVYVATSSGTNTITVVLQNFTQLTDIVGVPIRVKVLNGTTGPVQLIVTNVGGTPTSGAQTVQKPTTTGLAALVTGDIVAGQIYEFMWDGTVFQMRSPTLFTGTVPAQSGFNTPINLQLNCTASANALTCAMKAANTGNDATALAPIYIPFRDTTITNGGPIWRTITSAVSFTISGGNTMGCVSGAPCRLWITAIDNAGTVLLGLSNQSSTTQIFPLDEAILQTTGSGTGGGNTAGTIFTSVSAVSTKAIRIVGYVEYTTLTTAGNWTSPNRLQLFGPGIKKPGEVVQRVYVTSSTPTSTTATAFAATVPSASITPSSAANLVSMEAKGSATAPGGLAFVQVQIFRNPGASAACTTGVGANLIGQPGASNNASTDVGGLDAPATTSQQTYAVCQKSIGGGGTIVYCNNASATQTCTMDLQEIMGANDNDALGVPALPKAA